MHHIAFNSVPSSKANEKNYSVKRMLRGNISVPSEEDQKRKNILLCRDNFYKAKSVVDVINSFNKTTYDINSVFDIDPNGQLKMSKVIQEDLKYLRGLI